jgi:hypothetical protein
MTPRFPTTPMCDGALLEAFEPTTRPTDVFVATAAKSGQTWLLALLHHLRTGGADPDFGGIGALGVTPWLENPRDMTNGRAFDRAERLAQLAAMRDPRVFKLHVTWEEIPRASGSGAKVMTITRDPRDLPWSMYQHVLGMTPEILGPDWKDPGFDAFFDQWLERGYFFQVVRSFWPHFRDPDVLWLRYEDLKEDLRREAARCVQFLGWNVDDAGFERACRLADLKHMQAEEKKLLMGSAFKPDARFVREGAVGKNRARLSADQEARIVERARRELEPACFAFVMCQG